MLNDVDIKNLLIFLSRVSLTGQEAPTFTELAAKLQKMSEPKSEPVEDAK